MTPQARQLAAVIIGNDAVLAARPASGEELARACTAAGFDIVVPPSWGDELVADAYLEALRSARGATVVACACPHVRRLLHGAASVSADRVIVASPPVAVARYLRARYTERLLVTYVGDCPGASDRAIDVRFSPAGFFASLERQGISIRSPEARAGDGHDERASSGRHRSLPGGLPARRYLARAPIDRLLRVADATTFETGGVPSGRDRILLDMSEAAGCACARDRDLLSEIEPPRSRVPVLSAPDGVDVASVVEASSDRRASGAADARSSSPLAEVSTAPSADVAGPPVVTASRPEGARSPGAAAASAPGVQRRAARAEHRVYRPLVLATPALVLLVVAALGWAVYASSAGGAARSAASQAHDAASAAGDAIAGASAPPMESPADSTRSRGAMSPDSAGPAVPEPASGARANTAGRDSLTPGRRTDTASVRDGGRGRRRGRRAPPRRAEVVPGWLPQGAGQWDPADTARRSRARPSTPAARPDTTPPA